MRFIGVSNFSLCELKRAQRALSKHPIVSNHVRYNLVDRTIEPRLLLYCQRNRISIFAYSPLGRDLSQLRKIDPDNLLGRLAAEQTWKERGTDRAQLVCCQEGCDCDPEIECRRSCGGKLPSVRLAPSAEHIQQLDARIRFNQRSLAEQTLRRTARSLLQTFGYV